MTLVRVDRDIGMEVKIANEIETQTHMHIAMHIFVLKNTMWRTGGVELTDRRLHRQDICA